MTKDINQFLPLNELKPEYIKILYKMTVLAILIISIAYIVGIILFVVLFLLKMNYPFFAIFVPVLGYLWLITFGSKYVNNYYGFKKTSEGTLVYIKQKQSYSTLTIIHAIIFLVYPIIRLIYEIHNLLLIRQELTDR